MNSRGLLIISLLALSLSCLLPKAAAEGGEKHKIDVWLDRELQSDTSTAGMRRSLNKAREMWDEEMNAIYARLMKVLTKEQQQALRASQRAWVAFRDADGQAISEIIATKQGTLNQLTATELGMQRVRDRAMQLAAYEHEVTEK